MHYITTHIDKKKPRKTGECAIYLTLNLKNKTIKINTGVLCKVEKWDEKNSRIKGVSQRAKDDNLVIDHCLARINEIFVRYRLSDMDLTPELLKNEWKNPSRRLDFFAFLDEAIKERRSELSWGSIKHHISAFKFFKEYKSNLVFSEITPDYIEGLQRWLRTVKKNDTNTVHAKMKILRAYLNIAVRKQIIKENPFCRVKLRKAGINRVFLTAEELMKLWDFYQSNELTMTKQKVLRHFLFMCFTGVRISDLRQLTYEHVIADMLIFNATKTKNIKRDLTRIPLSEFSKQLIKDEGTNHGRIFRLITEQKMNTYIKEIVAQAGIRKEVTNHSGRHTFATVWLSMTNDLAQLQSILGHSNIADTMVYVHITESGLKNQMANFESNLKTQIKRQEKKIIPLY